MNGPEEILESEREYVRTRQHWIALARAMVVLLLLYLGPFIVYPLLAHGLFAPVVESFEALVPILGYWWTLIAWIAFWMVWTNHRLGYVSVTDQRIVHVEHVALFIRTVRSWRLDRIAGILLDSRGPVQTWLDYGTVVIRTTGENGDADRIVDVPDPEGLRNAVFKNITSLSALSAANADQERLLHTISHEVKAHLTRNVAALASIAEGDYGDVPDALKKMAGEALSETRAGVGMVTDLLKSSDFKKGAVSYEKRPFDLKKVAMDVIADLRPHASAKKLSLELTAPEGSYMVVGDETKIRDHVVRNLIDNAIRYTPHGSVRVALMRVDNFVVLLVADTGIGISESDKARLFTEGGRGEKSTETNPSSTGYGLFIAKSVLAAHGGAIWARSSGLGKGSEFYACLPESATPTSTGNDV